MLPLTHDIREFWRGRERRVVYVFGELGMTLGRIDSRNVSVCEGRKISFSIGGSSGIIPGAKFGASCACCIDFCPKAHDDLVEIKKITTLIRLLSYEQDCQNRHLTLKYYCLSGSDKKYTITSK